MIQLIVVPGCASIVTLKDAIAVIDDFEFLPEFGAGIDIPDACIDELEKNTELIVVLLHLPHWTKYFSHVSADLLERIIPVFVDINHYDEPFLLQEIPADINEIEARIREIHAMISKQ